MDVPLREPVAPVRGARASSRPSRWASRGHFLRWFGAAPLYLFGTSFRSCDGPTSHTRSL